VTTVHGTPPASPLRTGSLHLALAAAVLVLLVRVVGVAPAGAPGRHGDAVPPSDRIAARPASTPGRAYFAAPGRAGNSGSATLPLDLATALSARGPVRPSDVLWVLGGTYRGNFRSDLAGTAEAFIVVVPVHRMRPGRWDDGAGVLPPEFGAAVVLPGGDARGHAPWSRTADADGRWPSALATLRPDATAVGDGVAR